MNICNRLDRATFQPIICCLKKIGQLAPKLNPDVQILQMNFPDNHIFFRPLILAKLFKKEKIDIVHTHGWGGGMFEGVLGARLAGVPVIINGEHGKFFRKSHQIYLQKILASLCHVTFAVSDSLKKKIIDQLGIHPQKINVIPNGVDSHIFTGDHADCDVEQKIRHQLKDKSLKERFIIGCIGSLKPEKNQKLLLDSLKLMNHPNVLVLFIGDGIDKVKLHHHVHNSGLNEQVLFLGNRTDIPQLLSIVDVLVSTSIPNHEGLSNVVLEALSSKVPVIATQSVGMAEIVIDGMTGFLIAPNDFSKLAEKISCLLASTELRKKMGNHGRQFVTENYSLEKMLCAYQNIYLQYRNR